MKRFLLLVLVFLGMILSIPNAQAIDNCAGYNAAGDPYPCCANGNCTWWAWRQSKLTWGWNLPNWGNASSWASNARSYGYNVISYPSPNTIAVNTTASNGQGHVAWVTSVSNDGSVYVTEMNCGQNGAFFNRHYSAGWFNAGYIYPGYYTGTPYIGGVTPSSPVHSGSSQSLTFAGDNPGSITDVYVTFPNGGHAYLTGSQITSQNYYSFTIAITLGSAGTWSALAVNNNGTVSNTFSFYVY